MKKTLFTVYVILATFAGLLIGLAGAYGICVFLWGPQILDTALGSRPDRSHPAFWLSLALLTPCMLIGVAGAISLLILPVAFRFPAAAATHRREHLHYVRFLRWYGESIVCYADGEARRLSKLHDNDQIA